MIVGARCAGTATAVALARAGMRVVVLDKARFPSDTMSTHAVVPNGVREFQRMGALPKILALGPAQPRYFAVYDGDLAIRERYRTFGGIDYGLCVPRDQLDVILVESAREAGADVRERCMVDRLVRRGDRVIGVRYRSGKSEHEIHAKLVIGADGRRSRVAAEVGEWTPYRGSKNGRGFAFRYVDDPVGAAGQTAFEIYRAHNNMALVLPSCPAGRSVVVHMCDAREIPAFRQDPEGMWSAKIEQDPNLRARIGDATNMSKLRTTDDLASFYRRSSGPGWALVGDAGHFKDPVTGNGIRDALRHGRLLGEAAADTIDDPEKLDLALRRWEHNRDKDTVSTYHWGNRETRPVATTPLVRSVLATFEGSEEPGISDTFNRARPIEKTLGPSRMARGLVDALRGPNADKWSILVEAAREIPQEISLRRHRLIDGFRSTRPTATENAGWSLGPDPREAAEQSATVNPTQPAAAATAARD